MSPELSVPSSTVSSGSEPVANSPFLAYSPCNRKYLHGFVLKILGQTMSVVSLVTIISTSEALHGPHRNLEVPCRCILKTADFRYAQDIRDEHELDPWTHEARRSIITILQDAAARENLGEEWQECSQHLPRLQNLSSAHDAAFTKFYTCNDATLRDEECIPGSTIQIGAPDQLLDLPVSSKLSRLTGYRVQQQISAQFPAQCPQCYEKPTALSATQPNPHVLHTSPMTEPADFSNRLDRHEEHAKEVPDDSGYVSENASVISAGRNNDTLSSELQSDHSVQHDSDNLSDWDSVTGGLDPWTTMPREVLCALECLQLLLDEYLGYRHLSQHQRRSVPRLFDNVIVLSADCQHCSFTAPALLLEYLEEVPVESLLEQHSNINIDLIMDLLHAVLLTVSTQRRDGFQHLDLNIGSVLVHKEQAGRAKLRAKFIDLARYATFDPSNMWNLPMHDPEAYFVNSLKSVVRDSQIITELEHKLCLRYVVVYNNHTSTVAWRLIMEHLVWGRIPSDSSTFAERRDFQQIWDVSGKAGLQMLDLLNSTDTLNDPLEYALSWAKPAANTIAQMAGITMGDAAAAWLEETLTSGYNDYDGQSAPAKRERTPSVTAQKSPQLSSETFFAQGTASGIASEIASHASHS